MAYYTWDPFSQMADFSRLVRTLYGGGQQGYYPTIDLMDRGDELFLECDLPGVHENDVQVEIQDNVLTIQGRREQSHETGEGRQYQRRERQYGEFERSIALPQDVDAENIRAEYRDGVLEIHVPKSAKTQPRQIQVHRGRQGQREIDVTGESQQAA
jgi:HSP20 family protein